MLKTLFLVIFLLLPISLADLRLNEIMANPDYDEDLNEWIEIYNDGSNSIDVKDYKIGASLIKGSKENGTGAIVPPGYFAIIADSETRAYDNFNFGDNIIKLYLDGNLLLTNSGKEVIFYDSSGTELDRVTYPSLSEEETYSFIADSWIKTTEITPGRDNIENSSSTLDFSPIQISEFLPDPEGEDEDGEWVELYNSGNSNLDLLGLELYDNYGSDPDLIITDSTTTQGTVIDSKSYLVVYTNGVSGFLNNDGFEKITLKDLEESIIDEVTYSGSDEGLSWSLSEEKWQQTQPTIGYSNLDNSSSSESEIKIEEIYDLGSDQKAEWGDVIRIKLFVSKGNTEKEVVWIWIEDDGVIVTKKSKFNVYSKFENYTFTYPLMIPDNCNSEFEDGNYKIIASGLDVYSDKIIEIKDKPLCKSSRESMAGTKSLEYSIKSIQENILIGEEFSTEVLIKNNQKEEVSLSVWSYPYSGNRKYVSKEEKENIQFLTLSSEEEKVIGLKNEINESNKNEINFKVKILRNDRKTPYELKDQLKISPSKVQKVEQSIENSSKTLKNSITGYTIYQSTGEKAKRLALFFLNGCIILLLFYFIKNGIKN